jgi:hypothetical protein
MSLIKHQKDFWAGVLYIAFGVAAIVIALDYPLGSANRMGPGYFPRGLGGLMILIGTILVLRALKLRGAAPAFPSYRPILIVLGSVFVFALVAPKGGLVLAVILLVFLSSFASHEFRIKEAAIASVILAGFTVLAFAWGLQLQLPVWPAFME